MQTRDTEQRAFSYDDWCHAAHADRTSEEEEEEEEQQQQQQTPAWSREHLPPELREREPGRRLLTSLHCSAEAAGAARAQACWVLRNSRRATRARSGQKQAWGMPSHVHAGDRVGKDRQLTRVGVVGRGLTGRAAGVLWQVQWVILQAGLGMGLLLRQSRAKRKRVRDMDEEESAL